MPRRIKDGLVGPAAPPEPCPIPDLGFSIAKATELEIRLRQILYRWRPVTEDPENLMRDLYEIVEFAALDEPTRCATLCEEPIEYPRTVAEVEHCQARQRQADLEAALLAQGPRSRDVPPAATPPPAPQASAAAAPGDAHSRP